MKVRRPSVWDQEILYTTGDEYFASLLSALSAAVSSIEIETYIFEKGLLADRMVAALIGAAQRGLRVRLIVDGWGSPAFAWDYWPQLRAAGVRVRFFRVSPWILRRLPGDPHGFWQRLLVRFRRVNRGNHRKFCSGRQFRAVGRKLQYQRRAFGRSARGPSVEGRGRARERL